MKKIHKRARPRGGLSSGIQIRWHRRVRRSDDESSASNKIGGFISGMFSSGGGGAAGHDAVEGVTLSLADRATGPVILVTPPFPAKRKEIRLKWIKSVRTYSSGMMGSSSRSGIEIINGYGNELLRFDVLKKEEASLAEDQEDEGWTDAVAAKVEDAGEERRDDVIHKLELLVDWERRRQNYLVTQGEEETDDEQTVDEFDDDDESPSSPGGRVKNVLKGKIDQVKHFAERELELKKMKKEREQRKAKICQRGGRSQVHSNSYG
ncbi:hypothetical protein THAOC_05109 [Thalassiosira oceanica]|uniref:Uncharacterized protein n=1 Tax=Thalassiosira oceanica TaxID=159749 RepID=K0T3M9_THAOC|nr:hypothetical protein THAOC_05109 [Thalassiosira oceanica]|eukprot:EJK73278.1 hypothetical protein THAOC_05109 [Thalassiosira oceanica]